MRFLLLMILFTLVCLCASCGSAVRTVAPDTRPTAAQAQAQADLARATSDLAKDLAAAKQAEADDHARVAQLTKDYAAAKLAHDEAVMVWIGLAALFLAGAAEFLAIYESALAWLLKPVGYALVGAAAVAFLVRAVLPFLGWIELATFLTLAAVAGYSLRKTALATAVVAKVDALAAKAEAEAETLLSKGEAEAKSLLHLTPAPAAPAATVAAAHVIPPTARGVTA